MTTYFDHTDAAHLALLPYQVRDYQDLAAVAAMVEDDVIERYTFTTADDPSYRTFYVQGGSVYPKSGAMGMPFVGIASVSVPRDAVQVGGATSATYVGLRGYSLDASTAEAGVAKALRTVIAKTIPWRIGKWKRDPGLNQQTRDKAQQSYRKTSDDEYPPGAFRALMRYDCRFPRDCAVV